MNASTDSAVPLGPNITRDGREARVICNDRRHPSGYSIFALVDDEDGHEDSITYLPDGRWMTQMEDPRDLVGHLPPATPPEPAKPREGWVAYHAVFETEGAAKAASANGKVIHVQEVLP